MYSTFHKGSDKMNLKVSLHSVDKLREHRRALKNALVSSFMKYAVANYFLVLVDRKAGDYITQLNLQKLVYFAQGINIALFNEPLCVYPVVVRY